MSEEGSVVVIRMRQFGDVLAALGAVRAIKDARPTRRVVYVADQAFHPLLARLEFIDELLPCPPRAGTPRGLAAYAGYVRRVRALRPAAVIDLHGSARSAFLSRISGARRRIGFDVRVRRRAYTVVEPRADVGAGGVVTPRTSLDSAMVLARHVEADSTRAVEMPEIPVDSAEIQRARGRLNRAGVPVRALEDGHVAGLNPGKPYPAKEWPRDRFVALARELVARRRHVVVTWGPGEEDDARAIAAEAGDGVTVAPALRLDELPGVVKSLALLVTIDSGLKHLAVCLRVPTVTLFGSTDPREWHMGGKRDRVLWRGLSCSPCRRLTCPFGAPCMDIAVGDVIDAVDSIEVTS